MTVSNRLAIRVIKGGLRLSFKFPSRLPLPVAAMRSGMEWGARLFPLHPDIRVETMTLAGVPCEKLAPARPTRQVVLHLHGGAFMAGSPATHRALASELAARTGATIYVPDYRLAPENPHPAARDDCLAVYQALRDEGRAASDILLGGDSAGATLALGILLDLRDRKAPMPAGAFLLSPYVDSTLTLASLRDRRKRDPMLTIQALKRGSRGYCGKIATDDVRVSPIFANFDGLPPILIQAGTEEILHDDAAALAERCRHAGVSVQSRFFDGMWHDFQLFSRFLDQANEALDEVGQFILSQPA